MERKIIIPVVFYIVKSTVGNQRIFSRIIRAFLYLVSGRIPDMASTYQYPAGYRVRFSKKSNMSFLQKQFTKSKENSLISVSGIRPHRMWTSGIRLFRLAGSWCPASPVKRIDIEANGASFQSTGEQEATCRMSRLPKSPATQVSSDTSKSAVLRICPDPKYLAGSDPWFFRLYYKHQKFKENYLIFTLQSSEF